MLHYTGSIETFVAPVSGKYKLECWGASGVAATGCTPGLGGYTVGTQTIQLNKCVYVCVGGHNNCYNNQIGALTSFYSGTRGGGATHISLTNRGELKKFKAYQNEIIMVAGGGGSVDWKGNGGAGGGLNGLSGYQIENFSYGTGGTQTEAGICNYAKYEGTTGTMYNADFGIGGIGAVTSGDFGAQGGGGWYGGGGAVGAGAAGGGSGYINTSLLSEAQTVAGNLPFPAVNGGTETGHQGDGACVITQNSF